MKKNFKFNILKQLRLQKHLIQISPVHDFYWGCCWLFPWCFPLVKGKKQFYWHFLGFSGSVWTKFCQRSRIQEQLRTSLSKWSFSSTFQVPTNFLNNLRDSRKSRTRGHHEALNQIFYPPKTWFKWKTEELEGNNTSKLLQTRKVWMDFSHFSCRMVRVRYLKKLNWFYFFGKRTLEFSSQRYDRSPCKLPYWGIIWPLL